MVLVYGAISSSSQMIFLFLGFERSAVIAGTKKF
jgi:hypothetical protein